MCAAVSSSVGGKKTKNKTVIVMRGSVKSFLLFFSLSQFTNLGLSLTHILYTHSLTLSVTPSHPLPSLSFTFIFHLSLPVPPLPL